MQCILFVKKTLKTFEMSDTGRLGKRRIGLHSRDFILGLRSGQQVNGSLLQHFEATPEPPSIANEIGF